MSAGSRPWWASDADVGAEGAEPVDPLEAHRAARRGTVPPDGPDGPDGFWDPTELLDDPLGSDDDGPTAAHDPDVCGVCPICVALRALGESRPQLLEHLTEAGRHLAAALRSVVDEPPRSRGGGARPGRDPDPFERIDLD